jgi:hypothetical protein
MTRPVPRNLSARTRRSVAGNPVTTRLETAVANCFPGLELDIRALDRRFFPGLLFSFHPVANPAVPGSDTVQGAKLDYVDDEQDPMLDERDPTPWVQRLIADLGSIGDGDWYLHSIEQDGRRIEMYQYAYYENGTISIPLEGEAVWWLVRGVTAESMVTIELTRRDATGGPTGPTISLSAMRRHFVGLDGVFDASYRPGELTASLCSPWTHDFRDCACHYWASNHPDVVLGPELERTGPADDEDGDGDGDGDQRTRPVRVDWLRVDHGPAGNVEAPTTIPDARPARYDQYQINQAWEALPFVVGNREVGASFPAPAAGPAPGPGYPDMADLIDALENQLGPVELTLVAEYLYAYSSLRAPDEIDRDRWPDLPDQLTWARQAIRIVAVSEMSHLRWSNQILWTLDDLGLFPDGRHYRPVVQLAETIPVAPGEPPRPRHLRRLTPATLEDFIAVERPTNTLFAAYERAIATLRTEAPGAAELALRIDRDGARHFELFEEIRTLLQRYDDVDGSPPYLREIDVATAQETPTESWQLAERALEAFHRIIELQQDGFQLESQGDVAGAQERYAAARRLMSGSDDSFDTLSERLARAGWGVPFWS